MCALLLKSGSDRCVTLYSQKYVNTQYMPIPQAVATKLEEHNHGQVSINHILVIQRVFFSETLTRLATNASAMDRNQFLRHCSTLCSFMFPEKAQE